jgi:3-oxoacyl-[acyl-carrier-protein] synthase II
MPPFGHCVRHPSGATNVRGTERDDMWITGIGAVTPAGRGSSCLRAWLGESRSALRHDPCLGGLQVGRANGAVSRASRHLDASARLFFDAAEEAWRDAGLDAGGARIGLIEGSSLGPLPELVESIGDRVDRYGAIVANPLDVIRFMPGAGGAAFAQMHGITDPPYQIAAGSISGALAIAQACERIESGKADIVIAGAAESPVQRMILEAFRLARVQVAPGDVCLPFDQRRSGTALADGAGVMVLESPEHASARGARPRARILGVGAAAEAYDRVAPSPDGDALVAAASNAMRGRDVRFAWIKAHGTGTRAGDEAELRGLTRLLGSGLRDTPVTSLKSAIGHSLGASGAVEAVAAVLALEDGIVPGTFGFARQDSGAPSCTITADARHAAPGAVLLLSESFGGRAAAIILAA